MIAWGDDGGHIQICKSKIHESVVKNLDFFGFLAVSKKV